MQQQSAALQQQRAAVSQQQDSQHIVEGSYEYICGDLYTVINNKLTVPQQQQQQSQQQRQQCSSSQQHSTTVSPSSEVKGDFVPLPSLRGGPSGTLKSPSPSHVGQGNETNSFSSLLLLLFLLLPSLSFLLLLMGSHLRLQPQCTHVRMSVMRE